MLLFDADVIPGWQIQTDQILGQGGFGTVYLARSSQYLYFIIGAN
jgi:hypothetical protein